MNQTVYIIIATALKRTQWLLERSLYSVYRQVGVNHASIQVIIVDDNDDDAEINIIREGVIGLRNRLQLNPSEFPTRIIKNTRTRNMSGTGAWNTGIFFAHHESPDCFISILDDDDEYFPEHISKCLEQVNTNPEIEAVFQELIWKLPDGNIWQFPLHLSEMNAENFYRGNPGIQGSNLFVKSNTLIACGAFDESFDSTTDRDLLIRLTRHITENHKQKIAVVNNVGVVHHAHRQDRVTTHPEKKRKGLNRFYEKYKHHFTEADYQKSLKRASLLFGYEGYNAHGQSIVLTMAMHNNAGTVATSISSILAQKATRRTLYILVSDDQSTDESYAIVDNLRRTYPNIFLFKNQFGCAAKNRNWLQANAKELFPDCILIGRLDADDSLAETDILQRVESYWDDTRFDVLLMANHQYLNNEFTGFINRPQESLKHPSYLLERVKQMSEGVWEAELPSCNVFITPQIAIPYIEERSAEDHRNLVDYLLKSSELNIHIQPDWVYCHYAIDKHINSSDQNKKLRRNARKDLYKYTLIQVSDLQRKEKALSIVQKWRPGIYSYLGAGFAGVVFNDEQWVYKVHLPLSTNNFNEADNILFLQSKLQLFKNRIHFYPLKEFIRVDDVYILVYPFEKSEPVNSLTREDMVSFLAEMWQMKVICRSITKGNNFRRVNGALKLIDYEIEPYNDNLFLNAAARAFIQLDEFAFKDTSTYKLRRSTINNFNIPELEGFYDFVKDIFLRCADTGLPSQSKVQIPEMQEIVPTPYDGNKNPAISLLIKACIQDSETLYHDVKFLVKQLTRSTTFVNRCLLLDLYKEQNFIRQYTSQGNKEQLLEAAHRLKEQDIIDVLIIPPDDTHTIGQLNERWFSTNQFFTHTIKGVPVSSQLYAFEQLQADYILQMDVDVLIGFKNPGIDYLKGMIVALEEHPNALSIGFQIYQPDELLVQPITGQDGNIAPDVRCSLIHKSRLLNTRPFENECLAQGWKLSWYRALEEHQKKNGFASLRGGAAQAFYLHPQNYRKVNRWVWHTIQQGVKYGNIPRLQESQPEVAGNIFDWCLPKRNEELVVLVYIDEQNSQTLGHTLDSILAQDLPNFGVVLINNTRNENFVQMHAKRTGELIQRITVINFEVTVPYNEAIYKAIHYYLENQDSFVCLMLQGDLLLYRSLLSECLNRLQIYQADVMIGKEISSRTLVQTGMSRSNFLHPRHEPESMANGLAIFRKYLFDSLSHLDLKIKVPNPPAHIPAFSQVKQTHRWLDDVTNISILVPVVELSSNPIRFDHINVLRTQAITEEKIAEAKEFVMTQSPKAEGVWEKGRKSFLPNTNKIELDITYDCNLKCFHCNRSCTQAPTKAHMDLEQVQQFVRDSIDLGKKWQLINVLGGEPTVHPQFAEIVNCLLYDYLIPHSPHTTLQITSNGHGEQVQEKLKTLPLHPNLVIDYNSFKDDREVPYFTPFNLAPADEPDAANHEYHKGCWVTSYCGIGLNHLGYFACGVAGGIERLMKSGLGITRLADLDENLLKEQLKAYCRMCGNFTAYAQNRGDFMERAEKDSAPAKAISESWKKLYKANNEK